MACVPTVETGWLVAEDVFLLVNWLGEVTGVGMDGAEHEEAGAGGDGGNDDLGFGNVDWFLNSGVYFLRNFLFLSVVLPVPSTLTRY